MANRVQLLHGKLVQYKPIFKDVKYVGLIIVPLSLRRVIFSHFHAGPTGGHMGEYKTLFRIRMRFTWPGIRRDIKLWVKQCAHCCAYDVWRDRKSELYFSWPVTTPFYIMHVDLWMPGKLVDSQGNTLQLMNAMCDLTQFVVSMLVTEATAEMLGKIFMEQVVFTFGLVAVVVVDADSKFLGLFEDMCNRLGFIFWPLSRGNHKALGVEKYHRFLNKTQTIVSQDSGTHHSFHENSKTSQYAWNSAPIDDTDIPRCLAAVGRHFKFPMDVALSADPTLNDDSQSALFTYLRDVSNDSQFATAVLQILIEERRTAHRDRWNSKRAAKQFKVGDVVKAHVQVQSNSSNGDVKKLSYQARGPFQIKETLDSDSYIVERYNSSSTSTRKYKGTELYLLPPALFPHEPVDTMDQRYLNFSHAPMASPLKRTLNIELYNDTYFPTNSKHIINPSLDKPTCSLDKLAFLEHSLPPDMPSSDTLFKESKLPCPPIESVVNTILDESPVGLDMSDKLFFIEYTPEGTLQRRWYLVQVDIQSTCEVNPDYATNNLYWCVFLARHPDDKNRSDEYCRWWPDWYKYSRCSISDDIIYGQRTLIKPNTIPCSTRFIQWATLLPIHGKDSVSLVGPFDFESLTSANRVRQRIHHSNWALLMEACTLFSISPPSLGLLKPSHRHNNTCSRRKRKQPSI